MDNEAASGPVFHRLAFAEAIKRELTDYQVVVVGADDATFLDRLQGNLTSIRQRRPEELSGCTWKVAVGLEVTSIPKQEVKLSAELRMLDASCNECLSAWKPMCHRRCAALIEGAAGGAGTLGS
jgi:hypothetical protein